jgi:prepilin-type N-terminal cleavage/methylation domain-containing protein
MIRAFQSYGRQSRTGMTVIELLVVMAIIGILVGMLLPAVQAAREATRRVVCQNHLKQIGLGFQMHHTTIGWLPTGGWGWDWTGDADRGYDERQPGGWTYNLLPFIEQSDLHDADKGSQGAIKLSRAADRLQALVELFSCPSRRSGELTVTYQQMFNADYREMVAKSDYAVNCGDQPRNEISGGPPAGTTTPPPTPTLETGISFRCSRIGFNAILDGTTHTLCVGEKYLAIDRWGSGTDAADNESMFTGYNNDLFRSTNEIFFPPSVDRHHVVRFSYGSAHPAGFHAVMCDGSVHTYGFEIEKEVYRRLGNRADHE